MIDSRDIELLLPVVKKKVNEFLALAANNGVQLLVTSTYRDAECQTALYQKGRTVPGNACWCGGSINQVGTCQNHPKGLPVTFAKAQESYHNFRCAIDIVPIKYGKPVWDTNGDNWLLWKYVGEMGESCGLEWAGRWPKGKKEFAHFQYSGGLNLKDLREGKLPPENYRPPETLNQPDKGWI